jgi:hypothetical protein
MGESNLIVREAFQNLGIWCAGFVKKSAGLGMASRETMFAKSELHGAPLCPVGRSFVCKALLCIRCANHSSTHHRWGDQRTTARCKFSTLMQSIEVEDWRKRRRQRSPHLWGRCPTGQRGAPRAKGSKCVIIPNSSLIRPREAKRKAGAGEASLLFDVQLSGIFQKERATNLLLSFSKAEVATRACNYHRQRLRTCQLCIFKNMVRRKINLQQAATSPHSAKINICAQ